MLEKECTFLDFKLSKEDDEHKQTIFEEGERIQI